MKVTQKEVMLVSAIPRKPFKQNTAIIKEIQNDLLIFDFNDLHESRANAVKKVLSAEEKKKILLILETQI